MAYNKRFLYTAVGAPGSTHDDSILKSTCIYREILNGNVIPDRNIHFEGGGEIPLVTAGDNVFPRHSQDSQQRNFNKKLCSAMVVIENAHGMLKITWHILYKKTKYRIFNLKYFLMAFIMLHNFWISLNDPCKPRWRLEVQELS